ncbi:GAF and ANTAR domain-containing protein [Vallicoccus soli]|uniref:GAF and ANTAR domain-containing protein n=1 Tax=Vallicoccus soli TaxID=2339232 RepID=UPI00105A8C75|nr:GAF and ANTAR domain-containing protein [Vallicoccus soli]
MSAPRPGGLGGEALVDLVQLLAEPEVDPTRSLERGVALAVRHLVPDGWASVTEVTGPRSAPSTPAASGDVALRADLLQYDLGEGPCLAAARDEPEVGVDDLPSEARYPRWAPRAAAELGIASSLSLRLRAGERVVGALNLYAPRPRSFDDGRAAAARAFAAHLAVALRWARTNEQLHRALETRGLIGQAQGLLMERFGIDAGRAFDVLNRVSQDSNTRLVDVALRLVETRRTPGA